MLDSNYDGEILYFAIPKKNYENLDSVDITARLYGTYIDETERELLAMTTQAVSLAAIKDYDYIGGLGNIKYDFSASLTSGNSYTLYKEKLENSYSKSKWSTTGLKTEIRKEFNPQYTEEHNYSLITGIDLNEVYYAFEKSPYRKISKDEIRFNSITTKNVKSYDVMFGKSYEVYGYQEGASTPELLSFGVIKEGTNTLWSRNESNRTEYENIFVKYINLTTANISETNFYIDVLYNKEQDTFNSWVLDYLYFTPYGTVENMDKEGNITKVKPRNNYVISGVGDTNAMLNTELTNIYDNDSKKFDCFYSVRRGIATINYGDVFSYSQRTIPPSQVVTNDKVNMSAGSVSWSKASTFGNNLSETESTITRGFSVKYSYSSLLTLNMVPSSNDIWQTRIGDEIDNGDGTKSCTVYYELKNEKYTFTSSINCPMIRTLSFTVALDDYYMSNLGGKKTYVGYESTALEIYNEVSETNYSIQESGGLNLTYPEIANNTYQGIETEVSTDAKPDYTKARTKVNLDGTYSYKLKASAGETQMANIVLYDNIENVEGCAWRGTFNGVSFEKLQQAGVDISKFKTYYSTDRNQTCSLDSDGWILSSDYTGVLSDVKSVAIDMQDYVLGTKQRMYVEILMKSPKDGVLGSTTLNQYNASYQEFDDGDINLTTPLKTTTNLPSNTTEVALGDVMTNISIVKIWDDSNDKLHYRPGSITGKILQNGIVYDTFELSKENKWTAQITARMYNDSEIAYVYTVEEDGVDNYTSAITKTADEMNNYSFTITNSLSTDLYTEISGTKSWDDNDDELGIRPDSITVNLYQNDVKIDTTTSDSSKDWKYTFGILDKYDSAGKEYIYTVREEKVDGYTTEYIEPKNGVQVHFNSLFKTESASFDYVEIYYQLGGNIYKLGKWGGTSLADKTVEIPSTDFYVYWKTDSSGNNYYGFAIDSVVSANVEIPSSQTPLTLPSTSSGVYEECAGTNYPESEHNPYSNSLRQGWHYTTDITGYDIINHLVRYEDLHITKLIPLSDILAEHGTPSFIFKAEGSNGRTYYQTITFDENSDYGIYEENGIKYAILSTTFFDIEEDIYTVSEIGVSRFKLQGITDISDNATVSGDTVVVDLTQGYGYATFINAKTKWNNFSHNDIKVNEIDLEPKKPV